MKGLLVVLMSGLLNVSLSAAEMAEGLTAAQKDQLAKGSQVVLTEKINGKPWPRLKVFRVIDASPEEVAAVFFDYEGAKKYVPNVFKSEISKKISPCSMEVDYAVDVPILPDEHYTVCNTVQSQGDGYRFHWKLVRAMQTKESEGSMEVQPYEGKSLMCYENLVVPGSSMAGLLKGKAISQMCDTVTAIGTQVEKQKRAHPEALQKQTQHLRSALGK